MKRDNSLLPFQKIFPILKYCFWLFLFIFSVQQGFAANNKNNTTIAITQIVEHPSANKTREGILKALSDHGYHTNDNLNIIYDNAQGNLSTAVQIAQKYVSLKPNVIVAITTPSAQTVVTASNKTTIPIVFAAVTDPLHAKIVKNLEYPGGYVTGATDAPPIDLQIKLITMLCPKAKKIGVVFCPGEINAVNMLIQLEKSAQKVGLEIIKAPAIKTSEVTSAAQSLIGKVDAYFVALDNTVLSAMEALLKTASNHHIPVFSSDPNSVEQGALASVSFTQYDAGYLAGEMIVKILQGEKPGNIPVSTPQTPQWTFNRNTANQFNIEIPSSLLDATQANIVIYP